PPAAGRTAVARGPDRLAELVQLEQGVVYYPRRLRGGGQIPAHVRAGGEGARAGAREDDAATRTALQLVPEPTELDHHRARHGVQPGLVVDREDDDVRTVLGDADLHRYRPSRTTA